MFLHIDMCIWHNVLCDIESVCCIVLLTRVWERIEARPSIALRFSPITLHFYYAARSPGSPPPHLHTNIQILPDILQSGKLMSRACSVSLGKYHRDGNAFRRNAASIILHHRDTTVLQSIRYTKSIYSPNILNYGTKNPMLLDSTPSQWGSLTLTQMHRHCFSGPPTEMASGPADGDRIQCKEY